MLILGWLAKKTTSTSDDNPTNTLAGVNNYRHLIALIGVLIVIIGAVTNNAYESGQYDQMPSTSISTVVPDPTRTRWDLRSTDFPDSGELDDFRDR